MKLFYIIAIFAVLLVAMLNINMISAVLIGTIPNNITLASPVNNEAYYKTKVKFNLSSNNILNEVKYANLMDTDARCTESERFENTCWKTLCTDCNGYGNDKEKKLTMKEGVNKLAISAIDKNSNTFLYNITIFVESLKPKIISTFPRNNEFINGSNFTIIYTEYNLKSITLIYGNDNDIRNLTKNCTSGKAQVCSFSVNLSDYENQPIYYYFTLNNLIYNLDSQPKRLIVDTIHPNLTIYAPKQNKHYFKKTNFNFTVSEGSKVEFMDRNNDVQVWKKICSNCIEFGFQKIQTRCIKKGTHELLIRATDKAGNFDIKEVNFEIE